VLRVTAVREVPKPGVDGGAGSPLDAATFGLVFRRSGWRAVLVLVVLAQLAHVLLRPRGWVYEWRWATYQYQFSTVLLAPLVAGIAAVIGRRWSSARVQLASSPRGGLGLVLGAVPVTLVVLGAYVAGFVVVVVLAKGAGTPGMPSAGELALFGPAMAQLIVAVAGGYVVGWWTRSLLAAPLVAVVVFAGLLGGWVGGEVALVKVGGASASLVGLQQAGSVIQNQVVFFGFATVAIGGVAVARLRRSGWAVPAGAAVIALVGLVPLLNWTGEPLVAVDEPMVCSGESPRICVAEPYERFVPDLRSRLDPMVERLQVQGVAVPVEVRQAFYLGMDPGVGAVAQEALVSEDPQAAEFALVSAWLHDECTSAEEMRAQSQVLATLQDSLRSPTAAGLADLVAALDAMCRP